MTGYPLAPCAVFDFLNSNTFIELSANPAKFHFFDTGVLSFLNGALGLERDSSAYGNRFETWLIN